MLKMQQFREMVKDNEKKYKVNKTWKLNFNYEDHKKVKNLRPFIQEIMSQIRSHTDEVKLSHYDANKYLTANDESSGRDL